MKEKYRRPPNWNAIRAAAEQLVKERAVLCNGEVPSAEHLEEAALYGSALQAALATASGRKSASRLELHNIMSQAAERRDFMQSMGDLSGSTEVTS